ncbi:MAG: hypothetical protein ACYTA5_19760 [Planctomycetota bacterium]|jgi:hypothetical protein
MAIGWLAFLFFVLLVVAAAVVLLWRFWGAKADDTPACGRCGYIVKGLPSFTCPECGSDLREVGIVGPGMRRAMGGKVYIALWSILLPITAVIISMVVLGIAAPHYYVKTAERFIFCQADDLRDTIGVKMEGEALVWPWSSPKVPLQKMKLIIKRSPGSYMEVDLSTKVYRYAKKDGGIVEGGDGFGAGALLIWLAEFGVDTDKQGVKDKVKDVLLAINETPAAQGKLTRLSFHPQMKVAQITAQQSNIRIRRRMPSSLPGWLILLVSAFWLAVWFVGMRKILARRRRDKTAAPSGA